jgi:hypothetical protein
MPGEGGWVAVGSFGEFWLGVGETGSDGAAPALTLGLYWVGDVVEDVVGDGVEAGGVSGSDDVGDEPGWAIRDRCNSRRAA